MKTLLLVFLLVPFSINCLCQAPLDFGYGLSTVDFEDSLEHQFVKIDSSNVWEIIKPNKNILFLPSNQSDISTTAIVSDSNIYYSKNLTSSFQFKFYLSAYDGYTISFVHKYDFDKNKDGGIIETSFDNGETWNNIILDTVINDNIEYVVNSYTTADTIRSGNNNPGFTGLQAELTPVVYGFNSSETSALKTMLLRFTIYSDSIDSNNEGWMLDKFNFGGWTFDGIKDNTASSNISIYMNQTNRRLVVNADIKIEKLDVLNLNGVIIKSLNNTSVIDFGTIPAGVYVIKVNNSITRKIVVE